MKVQRCHACGARYNADRLEVGTVFDCNRCGAAVTVEASSPVSLALLIAGFLVLGALFLWTPTGHAPALLLPWDTLDLEPDLATLASLALWTALGLWVVVTALLPAARQRSAITVGLGVLALVAATATTGGVGGFPVDRSRSLIWLGAAAALGAGLVLATRRERGLPTTALLLGGGLALLVLYVSVPGPRDASPLQHVLDRLRGLAEGAEGASTGIVQDIGADVALLLAAGIGVLVGGLGLRLRLLAGFGGVLLAVALLLPGAVRVGESFGPDFEWRPFLDALAQSAGFALVRDGVALWAVLTYAVADLVRARGGAS